jgi:ketosteroid isomerase-like protein
MTSEQDPVQERYLTFIEGMKTGNVSRLVDLVEDDFVFMPPADTTVHGKVEVQEWYEDYFKYFTVLELETVERAVAVVGDCAVERITVIVKIEPVRGGSPIYDEARILNVWRRHPDGSWKQWQSMWNSLKPIGAGTNRFLVRFMQRGE